METRLPLLRATSTGISSYIDPTGRVRAKTKLTEPETLRIEVPMMQSGTLYTRLGAWPVWVCCGLLLLLSRRKRMG